MGWPNIITGFRIALVPVLVVLVLAKSNAASYAAAAVFVAGGLSDGLDGYLARRHGMTTRTGAWLDPLSDKFLVAAPVLTLTALGEFPVWGAVIILAREAAVIGLRAFRGTRGTSMPASDIAKIKTGAQLVAITLYLLPLHGANSARLAALSVAVAITVYSGLDYFLHAPRPPAPS
ncbi:MAG: CDP-diacylglycerol--glycerol-3-phosphate 3-phosphatidyltransferase [Actinomycetota bacterium]|nr:CDP-diacylglycerol--glycerol-3-phosphate 3-phosphatidyltransferase [Actinomycetota bacterium]